MQEIFRDGTVGEPIEIDNNKQIEKLKQCLLDNSEIDHYDIFRKEELGKRRQLFKERRKIWDK